MRTQPATRDPLCHRAAASSLALLLLVAPLSTRADGAGTPMPVGTEFQINTYTTSSQLAPSVASRAGGDFVVVWFSFGSSSSDTSKRSIQGQRFDSAGAAVGQEFQVNTYTTSLQWRPSVAINTAGDFLVAWTSRGSGGSDSDFQSVQGQCFTSTGTLLGDQFQVNTYTRHHQSNPAVAAAGDNFVVVWQSDGSDGSDSSRDSIQGQRFDSFCEPVGGEFQVNTYSTDWQANPEVAANAEGGFVVVWQSSTISGPSEDIRGQLFDSAGVPIGEELLVDTDTEHGRDPEVDAGAEGEFVVVWVKLGNIYGRRYDSAGVPSGDEFQINTYTTGIQDHVAVTTDAGGGFVVVWASDDSPGSDSSSESIHGRRFDSTGAPASDQFQVNTFTTGAQTYAAVNATAPGRFVVVWASVGSSGSDSDLQSVQGQRFVNPLFMDGFESGDTSAWPETVP